MGLLINFTERLVDRSRPTRGPAAFFFALGCPISYLAAERVERVFGEIEWVPMSGVFTDDRSENDRRRVAGDLFAIAERQAEALRLPLITPDRPVGDTVAASRAALWAGDQDRGARFALSVSRMVFCGGFQPSDPEVIAEAAAASGLSADGALRASRDSAYDPVLDATAAGLRRQRVDASPAIRIGPRWFEGIDAVPGASSFTAAVALYGGSLS